MTHYLIVRLNERSFADEYIEVVTPILDEMLAEISGLEKYEIIKNKVDGKNNSDVMVKFIFNSIDDLENNYKPHVLHSRLKAATAYLVASKTIFDE